MIVVRLSQDRAHVEMAGAHWSQRFPVCALPAWIKFYREMEGRQLGRFAGIYAPTRAALERVKDELGGAR